MNSVREEILSACPPSYPASFRARVARAPHAVAYRVPQHQEPEVWKDLTWSQVADEVDQIAAGFIALGVQPEQRVAIAAMTRIEWVLADLGIACAAAATTTVYPNSQPDDELFILQDSESVIVVAENWKQLQKVVDQSELNAQVHHIVLFDDDRPIDRADAGGDRVVTWDALHALGRDYLAAHPTALDERLDLMEPETLATLVYTSGTTGRPKGVRIPHRAWTYQGEAMHHMWRGIIDDRDVVYLWLPLSHVYGRDLLAAQMAIGFIMPVDGRIDRIVEGMGETHPTIMVGVPRIYEKIRSAVITQSPANGIQGRIARWAFAVGRESRPYRLAGKHLPWPARLRYAVADRLVFSKLRDTLGGSIRFMISGSAKLSTQVQTWFYSAGLLVLEGYGLTETAAIAAVNLPDKPKFGTVGPVTPGIDAQIAADGELLLSGPIVADGYYHLPKETAEAFEDGWFHTGDIGHFDEDGYLTITDRKKDLMKTSNGKYVAPQKVEAALLANVPYISQTVAVADGHPYVIALVTMDHDQLMRWGKNHGHPNDDYATLSQLPEIRESIDKFVRKANERLHRWETVKRYAILDHEFAQDTGELTPSMKVKRPVVLARYEKTIDDLYEQTTVSDLTPFTGGK
ncbi:AMP-dependent synthetase/ligase [Propionibacterium freudenreichii]|uniref:Acyl-CoA synthetase n=1 Tax=Propionibacterium freudenreichii TaxID=1744 RepID=A0A2C7ZE51_9ACTN|nr:long-chain fatty acid--CoA ligase [Propionibacterium freudenreichii]AJQ90495.1 Long-chain-fatty-acid--CoA ligase [Propionibacterium freudenreichii subsp. freudenreichii]MCT2975333.1 long-chain fatty acid--CoA ligase [Propionibacterium freudenreichii]MCT2977563.1 long-chain fatty acid--CoA ligase [Propionibacterium freudenreichii]MCT2985934.1 long-chain fatty acid--CoA ligase [Propionibacterium freudenreichii]MCT2998550.1 long-chain fatty acid--CoA ligase [Propionibacterium freudenreichii]